MTANTSTRATATPLIHGMALAALAFTACGGGATAPLPASSVVVTVSEQADPADLRPTSEWSSPINLGPEINSTSNDQGPVISRDELSIYFASTRPGGFGGNDLWVSRRAHKTDPWGPALNLGATINTSAVESTPFLSRDGLRLYFASARPGGVGGIDLWVSERADRTDDLGWGEPVNLGPAINSAAADLGPAFFRDRETERVTMYFYSTRPGGPGLRDIYRSTVDEAGSFTPAVLVAELSTPFEDEQPSVRRDGLEVFFASNRPGSMSTIVTDIWVARRAHASDSWSEPENLGPVINTAGLEARPALSFDGRRLYFFSDGHGGFGATDLLVTSRDLPERTSVPAEHPPQP